MLRSTAGGGFSSNQAEYVNTNGQINDIGIQNAYASPRPVIWVQDASCLLYTSPYTLMLTLSAFAGLALVGGLLAQRRRVRRDR